MDKTYLASYESKKVISLKLKFRIWSIMMTFNLHNLMWSKMFRQVESDEDDKTMMLTMLYICKQFKDHKNNMWKHEQNKTWEKMKRNEKNLPPKGDLMMRI